MKDTDQAVVKRFMPSPGSIVWAYILALGFLGLGFYGALTHFPSVSPMLFIMGGGWLGRAIEKTSLWWKISTSPPTSGEGMP